MSTREPRFEVVHSDAGWFARFVASNGREVWRTSESYKAKRTAVYAIDGMARMFSPTSQAWISNVHVGGTHSVDIRYGSEQHRSWGDAHRLNVRTVDERSGR